MGLNWPQPINSLSLFEFTAIINLLELIPSGFINSRAMVVAIWNSSSFVPERNRIDLAWVVVNAALCVWRKITSCSENHKIVSMVVH
mmetsp:Transcript_27803/g.32437  ORF Transcript_27803/g.32437 Transcript_27803/m.32437 type:complete len:87 (-) Transcript_27803:118-378(-)